MSQRNGEEEHAARPLFRPDHAAVPFHDMLADGKTQPCGGRRDPFLFHSVEAFKNALAVGFRDTRSLIGHGEHGHGLKGRGFARDGDDAAFRSVAAGVFQKVAEHLGDVVGVGPDVHAPVDMNVGCEFLGFHVAGAGIQRVFQDEGRTHAGGLEGHGTAFQPGKVQHVFHKQRHVPCASQYGTGELLPVFGVMRRQVEYGFGKAYDGGEGRAQLVRHFSHELPAPAVQADKVADVVEDHHGVGSRRACKEQIVVFERGDAHAEHDIFFHADAERR